MFSTVVHRNKNEITVVTLGSTENVFIYELDIPCVSIQEWWKNRKTLVGWVIIHINFHYTSINNNEDISINHQCIYLPDCWLSGENSVRPCQCSSLPQDCITICRTTGVYSNAQDLIYNHINIVRGFYQR